MSSETGHGTHRLGVGLLLVVIGGLILLANLDVLNLGPFVSRWWPLIIIGIGLWKLGVWGAQSLGSFLVLIIIGVLCLLANLGVIAWGAIFRLWPLFLIVTGIWVLFRPTRHFGEKLRDTDGDDPDFVDAWAIFGGAERKATSKQFKGGKATALFGGIDIDLRQAELAEGEHALDLTVLFGGIDVYVPEGWDVWVTGSPIFGGLDDRRDKTSEADVPRRGRLHINGFVMFGAVDIKS
jgi:predicted membrane protein